MRKFEFLFGVTVGEMLLGHTDNLSQALQKKTLSAAEVQHIARMVNSTMQPFKRNICTAFFGRRSPQLQSLLMLQTPQLP